MNYKSAATFRQVDVWRALFEDLLAGFLLSFTREKTATLEMPCSFLLFVSKFRVFCMVTGYRLVYIWSKIQYLSMFTHVYPSTTQSWDLMEQLWQTTAHSRDWKQDLWIPRPRVMLYHIASKASSIAKLYKWPFIHYTGRGGGRFFKSSELKSVFNPQMSIRQKWKIRVRGCVHVNNNSGNAAIYAIVKWSFTK